MQQTSLLTENILITEQIDVLTFPNKICNEGVGVGVGKVNI
jgi:hypothetical protein